MLLNRLVAFPESNRILRLHLFAAPFISIHLGVLAMIPVLLRRTDGFAGRKWQVTVATTALPVAALLSIFWNEVYRRVAPQRYMLIVWLLGFLPLGGIALCHRPATVLACVVVTAVGVAGLNPLNGDLLRSCYPPAVRSKVFSLLQTINQFTIMAVAYGVGLWLDYDREAFRYYMPLAVLLMGVGSAMIARIVRQPLYQERLRYQPTERLRSSLLNAYRSMRAVLRADPDFRRYELGFFVYGLGWMACHALLPFLVVDVLKLEYGQVAKSTQVTYYLVQLVMLVPVGFMMDRVGHIRMAGWAFALLGLYPLGLILSDNVYKLTAAIAWYGLGVTGVQLAWTIGPITLARDASHAPHYLAIHAWMVGLRAGLGQVPAIILYYLTGNIHIPLFLASLCLLTGGLIMFRLDRVCKAAARPIVPIAPTDISSAPTAVP